MEIRLSRTLESAPWNLQLKTTLESAILYEKEAEEEISFIESSIRKMI